MTDAMARAAKHRRANSKAGRLALYFGGTRALAGDIGVDPVLIYRWMDGDGVPTKHNAAILDAATRRGLTIGKIIACLDQEKICPTCGQVVHDRS